MIKIYCDGGCRGNQFSENIGGWGFRYEFDGIIEEKSGGTINTTNNKMELQSCIEALKFLKSNTNPIEIIMDSQYVITGMNQWVHNWVKNGWKTSQKKPVENQELWKELIELSKCFSEISFVKCKGHSDNEGNNHADRLANEGMDKIIGK